MTMEYNTGDRDAVGALLSQGSLKTAISKSTKAQDRDLTTGTCMTCDSMVRWPKELAVFRCSVCVTINDLTPISTSQVVGSNRFGHGKRASRVTLDRTSALIERCIKSYLVSLLRGDQDSDFEQEELTPYSPPPGYRTCGRLQQRATASEDNMRLEAETVNLSQPVYIYPGNTEDASSPRQPSYSKSSTTIHERCLNIENPKMSTSGNWSRAPDFIAIGSIDPIDRRHAPHPNESTKSIFKPLEDYIVASFQSHDCINRSFSTQRQSCTPHGSSEGSLRSAGPRVDEKQVEIDDMFSPIDARTLFRGDFVENAAGWMGGRGSQNSFDASRSQNRTATISNGINFLDGVSRKSPQIDWIELCRWYDLIIHVGDDWGRHMAEILSSGSVEFDNPSANKMTYIQDQVANAQKSTRRVLLKATESLLKRPGGLLKEPGDIRFLLIILANPLLYPPSSPICENGILTSRKSSKSSRPSKNAASADILKSKKPLRSLLTPKDNDGGPGQHSGIIKRLLGLLSNLPNESHHHLVAWFSEFSEVHFQRTTELVGCFVTYRLTRQIGCRVHDCHYPTNGLVPNRPPFSHRTSTALHATIGRPRQSAKLSEEKQNKVLYNDDWQIKAAARVMALLFAANNNGTHHNDDKNPHLLSEGPHSIILTPRAHSHTHGQILPTSHFYNSLLDYSDLIADFEAWETKREKFTFCQYPFFLSIWAKIQIMEHDARRQMEVKAREAFYDSITTRKSVNQYLVLKIRRKCLVEDSLKGISEVVDAGGEEIKKGLRIEFKDEEGIDAGGLRKEWFLLLVRDVLNPDHGMFVYDEESHVCYFNPNSLEASDQFFLVGVVVGLAIYNSTILDIALPLFAFRKLLAAGPSALPGASFHAKPTIVYTLEDLAEYHPSLARGLRQLLEFDGDVEETFCRDFVADVEEYGQIRQVPLCSDGEKRAVNNSNRREFVDLYVKYLLDTAVDRQFEPFRRGFFTVCGGNALSLFQPEEIELLVRGSDEPLDISSLQAVSVYDNWGVPKPAETEPVIQWFWRSFKNAHPKSQRKLLGFITGSDRIPAMGTTNLVIKLSCLGDDCFRFPVARTCFNMLSLWRYSSCQKFELLLWRAVNESEGFGLK